MAMQDVEDVAVLQQLRDGGGLFVQAGERDILLFRH